MNFLTVREYEENYHGIRRLSSKIKRGRLLRDKRQNARVTMKQLSDLADCSAEHIYNVERGAAEPDQSLSSFYDSL